MRSRVRSMRLMVLMARTLVALVSTAGAAMKVRTAKGLWPSDTLSMREHSVRLAAAGKRETVLVEEFIAMRSTETLAVAS